ncbi:MAG TPA: hypothetical protein VFR37_21420 [Longimicrobium sp.]|nr:hypothetical protein [Longimicrobium sp.]
MRRNRYDEARMRAPYDRGYGRPMGSRGRYDAQQRGGYDRGWRQAVAYGREPGATLPGMFTPFAWDPMMRWSGWDPMLGFVPYQDTPREWSYGLAGDARRYDHPYYRGGGEGYGRDYAPRRGYEGDYRVPPRQSPLYGRGGDRAVREWARSRGYDVEHTIRPRPGLRR